MKVGQGLFRVVEGMSKGGCLGSLKMVEGFLNICFRFLELSSFKKDLGNSWDGMVGMVGMCEFLIAP